MYSPTAKGKVLAAARPLLKRALGFDCQNRFADCRALVEAIDEVLGSLPAGPENRPSSVGPPPSTTRAGLDAATSPARAPASGLGPLPQESTGLPFQRLGHFRIVRRIGQGGMGDVYEGYDESLDRRVAVKVLPAALAREEDFVLRFHAEAAAAAKIDHPNVVPIYFIGEESGHHYFAMQFVDGESLAQRLARQPRLPLEEALELAAQCLAGLSAAHARGIIHRDVKPANILIDGETGRAMLADFGLVRRMDAATRMTATGLVLGTLDYIAPEQARGQAVDGRADLYALGVVVYQMLAGRLPFTADTPTAMLFQHAYEKPFPLRTAALGLPEPLVRIVERLLAKDLEQRYQDCGGVLSDLRALRQGPGPGEPHGWRPGNPFAGPLPSPSPSAPTCPGSAGAIGRQPCSVAMPRRPCRIFSQRPSRPMGQSRTASAAAITWPSCSPKRRASPPTWTSSSSRTGRRRGSPCGGRNRQLPRTRCKPRWSANSGPTTRPPRWKQFAGNKRTTWRISGSSWPKRKPSWRSCGPSGT